MVFLNAVSGYRRQSPGELPPASGAQIGNQTDPVAARNLLSLKIEILAEQIADRRAKHMQDAQGRH